MLNRCWVLVNVYLVNVLALLAFDNRALSLKIFFKKSTNKIFLNQALAQAFFTFL